MNRGLLRLVLAILLLHGLLPVSGAGAVLCIDAGEDGHVALEAAPCDDPVAPCAAPEGGDCDECIDISVPRARDAVRAQPVSVPAAQGVVVLPVERPRASLLAARAAAGRALPAAPHLRI